MSNMIRIDAPGSLWILETNFRRLLVCLFFSAIGILCLILQFRNQLYIEGDTASYSWRMILIAEGNIFVPDNLWPLGWPLLALPLFRIGIAPFYCFLILGIISYVVLLWCNVEILYPNVGGIPVLISLLVISLEPFFSKQVWFGITDIPFCAVIAVLVLLCIRDVSIMNSIIVGAVASFACHLRYAGLFLFVCVPVVQLFRCNSLRKGLVHAAITLMALFLLTTPLFMRNYIATNEILLTKLPLQAASFLDAFILWVYNHFRAMYFVSYWLQFEIKNVGWVFLSIGVLGAGLATGISFYLKKYQLIFLSFLTGAVYTGFMVLIKAPSDSRYVLPSMYLLLIWIITFSEVMKGRIPRLRFILLVLLLTHAFVTCSYVLIKSYNLEKVVNFEESIIEFRKHRNVDDKKLVIESRSWGFFALVPDMIPVAVDYDCPDYSLEKIQSVGRAVLLITAFRGPKPHYKPVYNFWADVVEDWIRNYPDEFKLRYKGEWIILVDHIG